MPDTLYSQISQKTTHGLEIFSIANINGFQIELYGDLPPTKTNNSDKSLDKPGFFDIMQEIIKQNPEKYRILAQYSIQNHKENSDKNLDKDLDKGMDPDKRMDIQGIARLYTNLSHLKEITNIDNRIEMGFPSAMQENAITRLINCISPDMEDFTPNTLKIIKHILVYLSRYYARLGTPGIAEYIKSTYESLYQIIMDSIAGQYHALGLIIAYKGNIKKLLKGHGKFVSGIDNIQVIKELLIGIHGNVQALCSIIVDINITDAMETIFESHHESKPIIVILGGFNQIWRLTQILEGCMNIYSNENLKKDNKMVPWKYTKTDPAAYSIIGQLSSQ